MITGVAIVPGALMMLPEYVGRIDPLARLRGAARGAVGSIVAQADRVVLVCATDRDARHSGEPVGVRIGRLLLGDRAAEVVVVQVDASVAECSALGEQLGAGADGAGRVALVVVADGSATRTEKAPGHLDERSHPFDEALVAAVRGVDATGLLALDPALALELRAQGRAPLQVLAAALSAARDVAGEGGREAGRTAYGCVELETGDEFGVLHLVARLERHPCG